jgi:hypothetical protein
MDTYRRHEGKDPNILTLAASTPGRRKCGYLLDRMLGGSQSHSTVVAKRKNMPLLGIKHQSSSL